jgi:hypothetical protein
VDVEIHVAVIELVIVARFAGILRTGMRNGRRNSSSNRR